MSLNLTVVPSLIILPLAINPILQLVKTAADQTLRVPGGNS